VGGYLAFYGVGDNVLGGQMPERVSSVPVSCNFFAVLGPGVKSELKRPYRR
jgi:hypothetical protein